MIKVGMFISYWLIYMGAVNILYWIASVAGMDVSFLFFNLGAALSTAVFAWDKTARALDERY